MKSLLAIWLLLFTTFINGVGSQEVLENGKPCSLTVEDLKQIDAIEQRYRENRKRELAENVELVAPKKPEGIFYEAVFTKEGETPIQDRILELFHHGKIAEIQGAEYVFANWPIAKAVAQAVKEGAKAQFLVDRSYKDMHSTNCLLFLIGNEAKIRVPQKVEYKKLMHDKILIGTFSDGEKFLVIGSYNLSYQANKNDENIIITNNPDLVAAYEKKLKEMFATCRSLKQKVSPEGVLLGSLQSCPQSLTQQ